MWTLTSSTQYIQWPVHSYQSSMKSHGSIANTWSLSIANWLKLLHLNYDCVCSHRSSLFNWINELVLASWYEGTSGECSSAVEHPVHIGVVTGSIPVTPTTPRKYPSSTIDQQRLAGLRPEPSLVSNLS